MVIPVKLPPPPPPPPPHKKKKKQQQQQQLALCSLPGAVGSVLELAGPVSKHSENRSLPEIYALSVARTFCNPPPLIKTQSSATHDGVEGRGDEGEANGGGLCRPYGHVVLAGGEQGCPQQRLVACREASHANRRQQQRCNSRWRATKIDFSTRLSPDAIRRGNRRNTSYICWKNCIVASHEASQVNRHQQQRCNSKCGAAKIEILAGLGHGSIRKGNGRKKNLDMLEKC